MNDSCIKIFELLQWHWKDIIEVLFWVGTLMIAWIWLKTWKKQLKWTIEYELAKRILHRIYQVERYFNQVRNPFISAWELYINFSEEDLRLKSESDRRYEEYHKAYKDRLDPLFLVIEQLNIDILEAEALWWNQLKKFVYEIFRHLRELQVAVEWYIWTQSWISRYRDYPKSLKEEYYKKVNWMQMGYFIEYNKDDLFALEFEKKIKDTENYLKPFLKK